MSNLTPHSPKPGRRGFTIVEIIMVFIIIGVLTAILVPVIANRAEDARIAAATSDLERISDAQERAGVDTGYYFRLYALNDSGDPEFANNNPNARNNLTTPLPDQTLRAQSLFNNRNVANNYYEDPDRIFIRASGRGAAGRGDYITGSLDLIYQNAFTNETGFNFNGPYLNWHMDSNNNDWPDDPWGTDYVMFTRSGMIMPPARTGTGGTADRPDTSAVFQTQISIAGRTFNELGTYFDRPTLVSLGPNRAPGDGQTDPNSQDPTTGEYPGRFGGGDDIIRQFGAP